MNQQDETRGDSPQRQGDSGETLEAVAEVWDVGDSIPYELRIGITGHRHLGHPEEVRKALRGVINDVVRILTGASHDPHGPHGSPHSRVERFDRFLARCLSLCTRWICPIVNSVLRACRAPDRWRWAVVPVATTQPNRDQQTPLKLTGISSLAIGSDQILIEVIDRLLCGKPIAGIVPAQLRNRYVEAVLPIPREQYETNYTGEDLARFHESLQLDRGKYQTQAEPTVVYPAFPSDGRGGTLTREDACQAAGEYVVNTSEIVIAIWDPDHKEKKGGTAAAARYAISRGKMLIWLNPRNLQQPPAVLRPATLEAAESFQPTGRWERLDIAAPVGYVAFKLPERAKTLSPNFHRLAAYNRDGAIEPEELDLRLTEETERFAESASELPELVRDSIAQHILPRLVRADMLSCRYRDLRAIAAWLWPTAAALAVSIIGFQIFFLPSQYWIAWIELAVLGICAVAYRVSLYDAWHDKWRNDRRLAEGLRSVLHSSMVVSDKEISKDDERSGVQNPLPFYSAGQSWLVGTIKRIVRKEHLRYAGTIDWGPEGDLPAVKAFLADKWILDQAEYHRRAAERHHRQAKRYKYLRLSIIALIVVVSIMHAIGVGHGHKDETHDPHHEASLFGRIDLWIALLTVVLPAWGAMIHAVSASEDHERLAERSRRMVPLLTGLAERIRAAKSREELQTYVMEAERLFDLESQEWAESLADRKPEVSG